MSKRTLNTEEIQQIINSKVIEGDHAGGCPLQAIIGVLEEVKVRSKIGRALTKDENGNNHCNGDMGMVKCNMYGRCNIAP